MLYAGIIKSISDQVENIKTSQGKQTSDIPEERVAILYNDATAFTITTMQSAQEYAHNLGLTPIVTSYNGTAYPIGRIVPYIQNVQSEGIKWLLVMAQDLDGLDAAKAIQDNGLDLWIKWITIAPSDIQFVSKIGQRNADFFMVSFSR